mmetsp:Transcript_18627/g.62439  ORF Transcript_18627/g.62439 Transcript_18627/m.62439 type:complete len:257 (-) Transcript_18627:987-1757(-)
MLPKEKAPVEVPNKGLLAAVDASSPLGAAAPPVVPAAGAGTLRKEKAGLDADPNAPVVPGVVPKAPEEPKGVVVPKAGVPPDPEPPRLKLNNGGCPEAPLSDMEAGLSAAEVAPVEVPPLAPSSLTHASRRCFSSASSDLARFSSAACRAVLPLAVTAALSAPARKSAPTQSSHPLDAAWMSGVTPALVRASRSAPALTRVPMSSSRPSLAAQCSAVLVLASAALTSAPALSARPSASESPSSAALRRSSVALAAA